MNFLKGSQKMPLKFIGLKKSNKFKRVTYMSRVNKLFKLKREETQLKQLLFAFCEGTKINGIYYLRNGKTSGIDR